MLKLIFTPLRIKNLIDSGNPYEGKIYSYKDKLQYFFYNAYGCYIMQHFLGHTFLQADINRNIFSFIPLYAGKSSYPLGTKSKRKNLSGNIG